MDDATLDARIARLTLERKVRLLTGATMFTLAPRAGDRARADGVLRRPDRRARTRSSPAAADRRLFPNATLLASSWSDGDADRGRRLLAEEA